MDGKGGSGMRLTERAWLIVAVPTLLLLLLIVGAIERADAEPIQKRPVTIVVKGHYPCEEDEILRGRGDYHYGSWTRYVCQPKDDL